MPNRSTLRLVLSRRASATFLAVLAVGGAVAGPAALASGKPAQRETYRARVMQDSAGPAAQEAIAAVQRLVHNGIIDEHQASVVDREINAGSVDPDPLVQGGVLTAAQMQAIANSLDQVKRSFRG
jgi:hypothetical protein